MKPPLTPQQALENFLLITESEHIAEIHDLCLDIYSRGILGDAAHPLPTDDIDEYTSEPINQMKILFIERPISDTQPFGIETGLVEGDNPNAEDYEQTFRGYIDPQDKDQAITFQTMKESADAIFEVDNIATKNNQSRIK